MLEPGRRSRTLIAAGGLVLLGWALLRTAWLCDDAFITLRTVDNVAHGYGPTWNPGERVQAYSHPLWFLLLTAACSVTGDLYFTPLALSLAATLGAVWLASRLMPPGERAWVFSALALAFTSSKAFVDFSSSGLENPLAHLTVAAFLLVAARHHVGRLTVPFAAAGLVFLTRMDLVLICIPALLVLAWQRARAHGIPRALREALLGLAPVVAWLAFSLFYYGFPFPNTAYAKLMTGLPRTEILHQGIMYYWTRLRLDPVTLTVIGSGVGVALRWPRRPLALAAGPGVALYLAYVVWIGGDFMSGRFFSVPFFVAALAIADSVPRRWLLPGAAAVLIAGLLLPGAPLRGQLAGKQNRFDAFGIADERAVIFAHTGLAHRWRDPAPPVTEWSEWGARLRRFRGGDVIEATSIGGLGLAAGPEVHIIDLFGLADPLLARLTAVAGHQVPRSNPYGWRVGHYGGPAPEGYADSIRGGQLKIRDPDLRDY